MNTFWSSLKLFLWMTLLTGIVYPLLITEIAQMTMKAKADGGLLSSNGKLVGARLLAQKFDQDKYFWARPSAIDYHPLPSGGSNLGPTSAVLKKTVQERKAILIKSHEIAETEPIPSELLFASGSGLDPHISPSTAQFQVDRIIKARGFNEAQKEELMTLIHNLTQKRLLGFIGEPCINVLELNIALDALEALI